MKCIWVGSVQRMPSRDQVTSLVLSSDGRYLGCHVSSMLATCFQLQRMACVAHWIISGIIPALFLVFFVVWVIVSWL